jgi:hypothetical protein
MKVAFRTKDEANEEQLQDFLSLSPVERFYSFLNLMQQFNRFPSKKIVVDDNNFVIEFKTLTS